MITPPRPTRRSSKTRSRRHLKPKTPQLSTKRQRSPALAVGSLVVTLLALVLMTWPYWQRWFE